MVIVTIKDIDFFLDNVNLFANNNYVYMGAIDTLMVSIGLQSEGEDRAIDMNYLKERKIRVKPINRTGGPIVHTPGSICLSCVMENTPQTYQLYQKMNRYLAGLLKCALEGNDFIQDDPYRDRKCKIGSNMTCTSGPYLVWMCQINMAMNSDHIKLIKRICPKERKYEPDAWIERYRIRTLIDSFAELIK